MNDFSVAMANRIASLVAAGKSFFSISRMTGMPPSRHLRMWTLNDSVFRDMIAKAHQMREPKNTRPKGDDPATWGIDEDNLEFSAQHGGIVAVEVKVTGQKTKQQGHRRAPDARMFDSFTHEQERAFYRIGAGARINSVGIGFKIASYVRVDRGSSGGHDEIHEAELFSDYRHWYVDCRKKKQNPDIAMDIIGDGMNLTESASYRGMDRRWVKKNLEACLNTFCERKGWSNLKNTRN